MSTGINLLSARKIDSAKPGETLLDGGGLLMDVSAKGKKSWFLRFRFSGDRARVKLGSYPGLSLADAREKREQATSWLSQGRDPRVEWKRELDRLNEVATEITFGELVTDQLPRITAKFENPKHRQQWESTFLTYCQPNAIWNTPISEVNQHHVSECIEPHWRTKHETMKRLRGRIENMMDIALARGLFTGENPARWKIQQHLVSDLTAAEKKAKNHASLEPEALPDFWRALSERTGPAADCMRLCILAACRTTEARKADWSEIDLKRGEWTIPAERMKMRREHVVPITSAMRMLLESLPEPRTGLLFKNPVKGNVLSENAMLALLKRMRDTACTKDGQRITTHGFRATFRNWVGDMTDFDERLAEHQLAHAVTGTEGHYRTRTAVLKRSEMMEAYSRYATGAVEMEALPSNVINL